MNRRRGAKACHARQEELAAVPVDTLLALIEPLSHAVQSGIAFRIKHDPSFVTPKHLRTGIDTSKAEEGGIARLLIRKGIITEQEYFAAVVEGLENENLMNEDWANATFGVDNIRFG